MVFITCVSGWFSANILRALGIVEVGTKALDIKVSGNITTNPIHCAASRDLTSSPSIADNQDTASVNITPRAITNSHSVGLALGRNPINNPTKTIITPDMILRNRSDITCPTTTAELCMGNDLKRAIIPSFMSTARLIVV
jgi:hypothetical protein